MERMINLRAFCNSLDHGKVDKNPGGEDTEKNWLGGEYKIIIVSDNEYKMIITISSRNVFNLQHLPN